MNSTLPGKAKALWARVVFWRRRGNPTSCQCLSRWPGGMGFAVLGREGERVRLHRADWLSTSIPDSIPLRRDADYACNLVVPFSDYRLLTIEPPQVPREELPQAVRWIVASRLPTEPIEELTVDFIRLDPQITAGKPELLVVVVHNEVMRQHLLPLWQAGIRPASIDIPEMAQRNLAWLARAEGDVALLSITPLGGLLTVTRSGELCFSRHIELDWARLTAVDAWAAQDPLDRLTLELQRTQDYIERHHGAWRIETIHVTPTLPPARINQIAAGLNANCTIFQPGQWIAEAEGLDTDTLAHVWFALGGALRGLIGGD